MELAPTVVVVAPLIQIPTTWFVMVFPEIDVPLIDAASAPGKGSTIKAMAVVDGAALASPQLFRLRELLVIVVLEMTSWGALACSVIPVTKDCVTVLPLMVVLVTLAPGASSARTIWPMSGPLGPNLPTVPVTVLFWTVVVLTPPPGSQRLDDDAAAAGVARQRVAADGVPRRRYRRAGAGIGHARVDGAVVGQADATAVVVGDRVVGDGRAHDTVEHHGVAVGDFRLMATELPEMVLPVMVRPVLPSARMPSLPAPVTVVPVMVSPLTADPT